jgi:hypothetical protein
MELSRIQWCWPSPSHRGSVNMRHPAPVLHAPRRSAARTCIFGASARNGLMDRISPLAAPADPLEADATTITPDNQKNGQRDAALHHDAIPNNPMCPCKAAARRFIRIRLCAPTSANAILGICAPNKHISATQMAGVTRVAALRSMVWLQGHDLLRIGPHSLRASGAMQLKLNGESDSMIQKMGRWSSNTWLQCLHGQISCLASGTSARMATPAMHFNVGTRAETTFRFRGSWARCVPNACDYSEIAAPFPACSKALVASYVPVCTPQLW